MVLTKHNLVIKMFKNGIRFWEQYLIKWDLGSKIIINSTPFLNMP